MVRFDQASNDPGLSFEDHDPNGLQWIMISILGPLLGIMILIPSDPSPLAGIMILIPSDPRPPWSGSS